MAAAATSLSASSLKHDSRRQSIQKMGSLSAVVTSTGVKKSSVVLQTKFQLVSMHMYVGSHFWYTPTYIRTYTCTVPTVCVELLYVYMYLRMCTYVYIYVLGTYVYIYVLGIYVYIYVLGIYVYIYVLGIYVYIYVLGIYVYIYVLGIYVYIYVCTEKIAFLKP